MPSNFSRLDFLKQLGLTAAATHFLPFIDSSQELYLGKEQTIRHNKEDYSVNEDIVYLNHGSIGTIPRSVQKQHAELLSLCETNPWLYMWGGAWEEPREVVRNAAANFVGAKSTEIAFVHNTTEVFNILAQGLELKKNEEVLFTNYNHDGASVPFEFHSKKRGYSVRRAVISLREVQEFTEDEWVDAHISQLSNNTKLLVLPHMDNMLGILLPVRKIAEEARKRGVRRIALDSAQTVGMLPVDVKALGVDVLATSAHKWMQAPKGISFAYFSESVLSETAPINVTWGQRSWNATARKFEDYGTRNLAAVLALGAAISYQQDVGFGHKLNHHTELRNHAIELSKSNNSTRWRSSRYASLSGALYAIEILGRPSPELAKTLYENHRIVLRAFGGSELNTFRISPNTMNSKSDLDTLFSLI